MAIADAEVKIPVIHNMVFTQEWLDEKVEDECELQPTAPSSRHLWPQTCFDLVWL